MPFGNSGASTILVAEDDDALRSLLTATLRREGHCAGSRRRDPAVRLLAEQEVDALLLDIRLGVDDGIALGHEASGSNAAPSIALMSGDSSAEEARERAVGLTDYFLPKPVSIPEVTSLIETLLGR